MKIYGAGLSGLLAACAFQTAEIHEAQDGPHGMGHKALLRFHSTAVADLTGIEFKKVTVHKGLWYAGKFQTPNIRLANWYSQKVTGKVLDRSIWDLQTVERYIAPEDFIDQLERRHATRIRYASPLRAEHLWPGEIVDPCISTVPMNQVATIVKMEPCQNFSFQPIVVRRWRLPQWVDVYQTIYFPSPLLQLYRASITGNLLIAEYIGHLQDDPPKNKNEILDAFGLEPSFAVELETVSQRYGKIAPIDNAWRQRFMFELSTKYKLFSLGRFATWRNILLDDVVKDLAVIRRLMVSTPYQNLLKTSMNLG